jgi:hypothetical protein
VKDVAEYLAYVGSLILMNTQIQHWQVVREVSLGELGLFRYRLITQNGDFLEIFERFEIRQEQVLVTKYSYWQRADGQLLKRWDNAPHHPEISTHPNHLQDGDENNVLPHDPINLADVLAIIR